MTAQEPPAPGTSAATSVDDELAVRERSFAPASGLAVTSLVLGATAAILGATLVWFFLALPFGVAAIACAVLERRSTRRQFGQAAGGIVTAGMVLGAIAIPLSLGGLVVIPRMQDQVEKTIGLTQDDVSEDLSAVEETFSDSVDDLDKTLSENVDESTDSLQSDFLGLERTSQKELREVEERLKAVIAELERTTGADLSELERVTTEDLGTLEIAIHDDIDAVDGRVSRIEATLAGEAAMLEERVRSLEAEATSVTATP